MMEILDDNYTPELKPSLETAKEIIHLKLQYNELAPKVKHGKYALIALIVISFIGLLYEGATTDFDLLVLVLNALITGLYAGFYLWSDKNPSYAILAGIILYLLINLLIIVGDPIMLIKGIIIKIVVIIYLFQGFNAARKIQPIQRSLQSLGVNTDSL